MTRTPREVVGPALPPVLDFLGVLWELNHGLEVASREMLRTSGVTAQQLMMLRVVRYLQPVSAGVLAGILHLHPGTLSASLKRLEGRGLVQRHRGAEDARRVMISLTGAGAILATDVAGTVEQAVANALAQTHPSRVKIAQSLLRRIAGAAHQVQA
ncbi:MAG: MarR family transcriptional regulator [Gemmatimonadaceae bacterium]